MGTSDNQSFTLDRSAMIVFGTYGITMIVAPLYPGIFNKLAPAAPEYLLSVLGTATLATMILLSIQLSNVRSLFYAPLESGDSIWNELILYSFSYVFFLIATSLAVMLTEFVLFGSAEVPFIVHHLIPTSITIASLYLRRKGVIKYPTWLQAREWRLHEYVVLFGAVFMLTYTSLSPVFGPTAGALSVVSVFCGGGAVALRLSGVFSSNRQQRAFDVTQNDGYEA